MARREAFHSIDEAHPAFHEFWKCYDAGASVQDIYNAGQHGYGKPYRVKAETIAEKKVRKQKVLREFSRMFQHRKNLVEPLESIFSWHGKRVLDFGCGTGALSVPLAQHGAIVIGVDPALHSLKAVQWRRSYLDLPEHSVSTVKIGAFPPLPFTDSSFDVVIVNSVLEFIPSNREQYIHEWCRVLKPEGFLVISTENGWFPRDYYTRMWLPRLRRKQAIKSNAPYGASYLEIRKWIKSNGGAFKDISRQNHFNSIDKLARRVENPILGRALGSCNHLFKTGCRGIWIPSDVFLPYATFIFQKLEPLTEHPEILDIFQWVFVIFLCGLCALCVFDA